MCSTGLCASQPGARYPEAQPSALGEDEEWGADRQELSLQAVGPPASVGAVLAGPPDLPGLQPPGKERWAGGELRLAVRINVCWVGAGLAHSCSPLSETTPDASEVPASCHTSPPNPEVASPVHLWLPASPCLMVSSYLGASLVPVQCRLECWEINISGATLKKQEMELTNTAFAHPEVGYSYPIQSLRRSAVALIL